MEPAAQSARGQPVTGDHRTGRQLEEGPVDDQYRRQHDSHGRADAAHDEAGVVVAQHESLRLSIADQGGLVRGQRPPPPIGQTQGNQPQNQRSGDQIGDGVRPRGHIAQHDR